MKTLKSKMKNGKCFGLLWLCVLCLLVAPQVTAQTIAAKNDLDPLHLLNNSVRALVKRVSPSVVQILVTGYGPVQGSRDNTSLVVGKQVIIGSGVVVDPDGYILTNAHVVNGAHRVEVKIPGTTGDQSPGGSPDSARARTVEA